MYARNIFLFIDLSLYFIILFTNQKNYFLYIAMLRDPELLIQIADAENVRRSVSKTIVVFIV